MHVRGPLAPATLVRYAVQGDGRAWTELVVRFDGFLRAVLKSYGLDRADVDDVIQTTWLRALGHVDRLNEPAAIGGWLAVTARREALRLLQRGVREVLCDDAGALDAPDTTTAEAVALEREREAALREAVRRLNGRQRQVVSVMLEQPSLSYDELAEALGMPIGSIGPTRKRAFARLRHDAGLAHVVST